MGGRGPDGGRRRRRCRLLRSGEGWALRVGDGDLATYTDIICRELAERGWSYGHTRSIDAEGRLLYIADASRGDGHRYVAQAETLLTAYMELRGMTAEAVSLQRGDA